MKYLRRTQKRKKQENLKQYNNNEQADNNKSTTAKIHHANSCFTEVSFRPVRSFCVELTIIASMVNFAGSRIHERFYKIALIQ